MKTNYYRKQITIIKMSVNHLPIDGENYRDMLEDCFKVRSCTDGRYHAARVQHEVPA